MEDGDVQFYNTHKSLGKKMKILDWILGSYGKGNIHGDENPLDMARRINPKEIDHRVFPVIPNFLVGVHLGNPSHGPDDKVEEEKEEEEKKN